MIVYAYKDSRKSSSEGILIKIPTHKTGRSLYLYTQTYIFSNYQ